MSQARLCVLDGLDGLLLLLYIEYALKECAMLANPNLGYG